MINCCNIHLRLYIQHSGTHTEFPHSYFIQEENYSEDSDAHVFWLNNF